MEALMIFISAPAQHQEFQAIIIKRSGNSSGFSGNPSHLLGISHAFIQFIEEHRGVSIPVTQICPHHSERRFTAWENTVQFKHPYAIPELLICNGIKSPFHDFFFLFDIKDHPPVCTVQVHPVQLCAGCDIKRLVIVTHVAVKVVPGTAILVGMLASALTAQRLQNFLVMLHAVKNTSAIYIRHKVNPLIRAFKGFKRTGNTLPDNTDPAAGNSAVLHILDILFCHLGQIQIIVIAAGQTHGQKQSSQQQR